MSSRASEEDASKCVARQKIALKCAEAVIATWNAQERNANRLVQVEVAACDAHLQWRAASRRAQEEMVDVSLVVLQRTVNLMFK